MYIVAMNIRAPRDDQLRETKIFRGHPKLFSVDVVPRDAANLGTNRAIELARSETMKEPAVHRAKTQHANRSCIAVRQNRLRTVRSGDLLQARRNCIERFVPTHALKGFVLFSSLQRPLRRSLFAPQRIKNSIRRINAVKIFGYFAAKKSLRNRLRWVALDFDGASIFIDGHQHGAAVGTIVRTDGMHD